MSHLGSLPICHLQFPFQFFSCPALAQQIFFPRANFPYHRFSYWFSPPHWLKALLPMLLNPPMQACLTAPDLSAFWSLLLHYFLKVTWWCYSTQECVRLPNHVLHAGCLPRVFKSLYLQIYYCACNIPELCFINPLKKKKHS